MNNYSFWGARDNDGMPAPAPTGYDATLDNIRLPADCEPERDMRPVYWIEGLGFFVMAGAFIGFDQAWVDVENVAPAGHKRWRVQNHAMINLGALPYFRVADESGEIV